MPGSPQWVRAALFGDRLAPEVRRAILAAYTALAGGTDAAGAVTLAALERAYEQGGTEGVIALLFDPTRVETAMSPVRFALRDALHQSAAWWVDTLPAFRLNRPPTVPPGRFTFVARAPEPRPILRVRFDALNPRAVDAARTLESVGLSRLTEDAKAGVRATAADAITRGLNPRETARALRSVVGLTEYDASLLANYRAELEAGHAGALARQLRDRRFDRTVARGNLPPAQVDTYAAAYERKLRAWRAETVSRTATLDALREGQRLVWEQAVAQGGIAREELRRFWKTAGDARVRPTHREIPGLNPNGVGFDEPFQTPDGPQDGPYGWNCRCVLFIRPVVRDASGAVLR